MDRRGGINVLHSSMESSDGISEAAKPAMFVFDHHDRERKDVREFVKCTSVSGPGIHAKDLLQNGNIGNNNYSSFNMF